jgi:hypothetical protein
MGLEADCAGSNAPAMIMMQERYGIAGMQNLYLSHPRLPNIRRVCICEDTCVSSVDHRISTRFGPYMSLIFEILQLVPMTGSSLTAGGGKGCG